MISRKKARWPWRMLRPGNAQQLEEIRGISVILVVALCGALAGCAGLAPQLTMDERKALSVNIRVQYEAYQECMVAESDRYSHVASAPPSDIALGAQAGCQDAFGAYQKAVLENFSAVVSRSGREAARERAEAHTEEAAQRTRHRIVRRVLIQRQ